MSDILFSLAGLESTQVMTLSLQTFSCKQATPQAASAQNKISPLSVQVALHCLACCISL